jgi:NADPH-dependent 2,4-dienoyl-CoA reductase/sulfur reductase-like enzyme
MKNRRILVIGGLAAGPSAAAKAARTNPQAEVTLFEATGTVSYGICESPYAISGVIGAEEKLVAYTPERLRDEKGIGVKTLHRVEQILPTRHRISVRDIRNRGVAEFEYEKLIIATGATPRRLNVPGEDGRNVFHVGSRDDTRKILATLETESPQRAVIIGGGYIGMEMSEALRVRGLDVTLLHRQRLPMAGLEQETRERIHGELEQNGVHFVTNVSVEALLQDKDARVRHILTNRGSFESDLVILSVGVEPNIGLAQGARISLGENGGIITDEFQQTNADSVYAAGDCCEVKNIVSGKRMYLPLATVASRAAWVAGENAAGGRASFKGAIRAIGVKVFGLEVAQVGLSAEEAAGAGFDPVTESITAFGKVALMPGSEKVTVRLILDRRSGRLIGANLYGGSGSVLRANTIGVAIQHKLTIDELASLDLIYAPPFAPLWDPILVAANQAKKKLHDDH